MADVVARTERSRRTTPDGAGIGTAAGVGAPRPLPRRAPVPSARAVVGGFLIALSALGIFVAWSQATGGPDTTYVVARRDLPVGTRLTTADLDVLPMALPDRLARRSAFSRPGAVVGATTVGPIRAGELVQAGDLVRRRAAGGLLEVSFAIEAARALGGDVRPGERVDVLATLGTGASATTSAVVRQAQVVDVAQDRGGLAAGATRPIVVRLAVATADDAVAVAHAVDAGAVTLVRSPAGGP